jgi:type I restriction enzyme S subunit
MTNGESAPLARLKPYPAYKDSGVEWLGRIPTHWELKPLKHLTTFVTGWTPPTGRADLYGGDHPWANIGDLGPKVLHITEKTISDTAIREARMRIAAAGSLLFSFKLSVGTVSLAGADMYTNEAIAAFAPSDRVDTGFLYWAAPVVVPHNAQDNIYGAPLLSRERIANATLVNPPVCEQRAIASFLDRETARIDALVAKKKRLIELLSERRTGLITQAISMGLNHSHAVKDAGLEWLRAIPDDWQVKRLKFLTLSHASGIQMGPFGSMLKELTWRDTGFKLYGQENTISGDMDRGSRWLTREQFDQLSQYRLREGDIVLTRKGSIGNARLMPRTFPPGIIDSDTIRVRVDECSMSPSLLTILLHDASYVEAQIEAERRGAVLGGLNSTTIADLEIAVPPREQQDEIVARVGAIRTSMDRLVATTQVAVDALSELRTALISAAVTGRIDVCDEAA